MREARRALDQAGLKNAQPAPVRVVNDHEALDDPAARAALLRTIERIEREPSLLGASPHLMAIAMRHE